MKILHVSDLHTRYSRQEEYRSVFSNFYAEAEKVKPDLIVITGDLTNTKANMFPEQVDLTSEFLRNVASISKVLVIPGNHDGLVRNKSRMDALTPIINSLNNENIIYLKDSGKFEFNDIVDFYHVSVFDDDFNIVEPDREDKVNIFLYHGTIEGCILQNGRVVEQSRLKKEMLGKYDVAMLGDIHKEQTIKYNDCIIRQAGSLIQQNFGEELEGHGFTLWDIDKNNVSFEHIEIDNDYKYYNFEFLNNELVSTVRLDNISKYPNIKIRYKDTSIAIIEEFLVSLNREYKVYLEDTSMKKINVDSKIDKQIIDDVEYQNSIIESSKLAPESMIKEIKELNRSINEKTVRDDIQKSNIWNIKKIKFKNMFSFGGDIENEIDMENINGLVGIFGKNFQGKSSIFNIISYTLFDKCEKSWLIRDIANFEANDFYCEIVFDINNIEYVVKRYGERKEKTFPVNVEFYRIVDGQKEDLAGSQRKDTNKLITNCVGTYDDFILTTFSVQNDFTGLIDLKQSEIKDMLYRFFNLEYFDKLLKIAKEELKVLEVFYNKVENEDYSGKISYYKDLKSDNKDKQKLIKEEISNLENSIKKIEEEKDILVESLPNIEDVKDIDVSLLERDFENLNKSLLSNKQELARVEELISELEKVNLDGEKIESEIKNLKQKSKDLYLEIKTEKSIVDIDKLEKYVAEERDKDFSLIDEITRDLEELDEYKQIPKEVIEEAKQKISLLEDEIKLVSSKLNNVERDHQSKITEKKITKITADKLNTIEYDENCPYCENFVKDYTVARSKLIDINEEILNFESEVKIIDSEKAVKESELKEKKLKLSEMEQQNNRVEELIRGLDYLRKQKEDSNKLVLRYLEEIEEANIANKKSIETKESNELIRKEIKYVNGLLDELDADRQKVNELNKLINVKEKLLNGEKDIELDVREISFKLSMVESKSEQIEKYKIISEKIKAKSLELKDEREMLKSKSEESISLASENKNIDEKIKELNNFIDERNKMFDKVALYKAYCKVVDKNGLPYFIIKNIIPTIEYDANNILKDISEYKLVFELEGSNINIYINYDGKIWSVGTASGMEKFSASIALRVALTNNTNLSRGNFLMIDEGFGTLDSDHLLDVGNMLKSMNNYFKTIFVISHLDFINDIVDDRITIFKDERGISQINR